MDGEQSEQYQYFCTLLVRGFLEARRHVERISTLIQMNMLNSMELRRATLLNDSGVEFNLIALTTTVELFQTRTD